MYSYRIAATILAVVAGGCDPLPDEQLAVGMTAQPLLSQQQNVAEIVGEPDASCTGNNPMPWCGYFSSASKTLASYAIANNNDMGSACTGSFIGPRIYMSAGHCGGMAPTIRVITYRGTRKDISGQGQNTVSSWTFATCTKIWTSSQESNVGLFPDAALYRGAADLQLSHCNNVVDSHGRSVPPGQLLGWLDFDTRNVGVGEQVWRIWANPVSNVPYNQTTHMLMSRAISAAGSVATITSVSERYGFQYSSNYLDNTCTMSGASGSPGLSETWTRILTAPLTDGGAPGGNVPCGNFARSVKVRDLFPNLYVDPIYRSTQLNNAYLLGLGLVPTRYFGKVDRDGNYMFDMHEDIEVAEGEIDRPYFFYNWDSRRQNTLWTMLAASQVYTDNISPPGPAYGIVHLESNTIPVSNQPFAETLLRHDTFPLEPSTNYRVNMRLNILAASHSSALQFRAGNMAPVSIQTVPGMTRVAFRFTTPSTLSCDLVSTPEQCGVRIEAVNRSQIMTTPLISADLTTLSVTKENASRDVVFDFDDHDKRNSWRDGNTGARALILPDGVASALNAVPDWAGAVMNDTGLASGSDWALLNEHLGFVPGESYTVFFKVRASTTGTYTINAHAVNNAGTVLASTSPSATTSWSGEIALGPFVAGSNMRIRFGANSYSAANAHVLVDDVRVRRN